MFIDNLIGLLNLSNTNRFYFVCSKKQGENLLRQQLKVTNYSWSYSESEPDFSFAINSVSDSDSDSGSDSDSNSRL